MKNWEERFKFVERMDRSLVIKTVHQLLNELAEKMDGMKISKGGNFNSVEEYANSSWNDALEEAIALIRSSISK